MGPVTAERSDFRYAPLIKSKSGNGVAMLAIHVEFMPGSLPRWKKVVSASRPYPRRQWIMADAEMQSRCRLPIALQ